MYKTFLLIVVNIINGSAHFNYKTDDFFVHIASASYFDYYNYYGVVVYCHYVYGDCSGVNVTYSTTVVTGYGPKEAPTFHSFTFTNCPPLWEFRNKSGDCKLKEQVRDKILRYAFDDYYFDHSSECRLDSQVLVMPGYCVSKNNKNDTVIMQ